MERTLLIHERQTAYTRLRVVDKGPWRYLVFDDSSGDPRLDRPEGVYQSRMRLDDPLAHPDLCALTFQIPFFIHPRIQSVFFIGLGGGTVISRYLATYPDIMIRVAEIDPAVVEVALDHFCLPVSERLEVVVSDGRSALEQDSGLYDLICVDAFWARSVPRRLVTREFARVAQAHLRPGGLIAVNVNGALTGPRALLQRRVTSSFSAECGSVCLFPTRPDRPDAYQMILLLAGASDPTAVVDNDDAGVRRLIDSRIDPACDVPVLTDDAGEDELRLYID